MNALRAVIADDEPIARRGLRKLLTGAQVEVVGEARNGREAVSAIRRLTPDLAVLDVQMPELDGIGVVRELSAQDLPQIIFVTAFDRYAIAAFDLHAVDYVLKPVNTRRFGVALERARHRLSTERSDTLSRRMEQLLEEYQGRNEAERFLVRSGNRSYFVPLAQVEWLEASGNYVRLHTATPDGIAARPTIRDTLRRLESWLPPRFARVHRSAMVNLDYVQEIAALPSGDGEILLKSGGRVGLSRRYVAAFHRRVGPAR
jgi:two-component system LytT family response regulator